MHIEIPCDDQAAAATFYHDLFGWEVDLLPEMEYAVSNTPENVRIGFPIIGGSYERGQVVVHVTTPDVDASLADAVGRGASLVYGPMAIPGVGDVAVIRDPHGNPIGLYNPRPDAI